MDAEQLKQIYLGQIQQVQVELRGLMRDQSWLYNFAVDKPADFYIDSRNAIKGKRRIEKLVKKQLLPLYRKVGWRTGSPSDVVGNEVPRDLAGKW